MLKRLAPLAIAGAVGFLLASLLNGGTPASAVSTTSDQVKLINYTVCIESYTKGSPNFALAMQEYGKPNCNPYLK
jgi:hypothetical protein